MDKMIEQEKNNEQEMGRVCLWWCRLRAFAALLFQCCCVLGVLLALETMRLVSCGVE